MGIPTRHVATALLVAAAAVAQTSCIDDELRYCDDSYQLDYELRLVTNISTELQTVLATQADLQAAEALRGYLSNIFTDHAHDVDLAFYATTADSLRQYHDVRTMNASQTSFQLQLPLGNYMHTAVANVANNGVASLLQANRCHEALLATAPAAPAADHPTALRSHRTGLFTARRPMDLSLGGSQHHHVHLYMANCAAALVLDTAAVSVSSISVATTGMAVGFSVADSVYRYSSQPPVVLADAVAVSGGGSEALFCAVSFPSRDPQSAVTRLTIETDEPFRATEAAEALWGYQVDVALSTGAVVRSQLTLRSPLRAGQLKILKGWIDDDGHVRLSPATTGLNVSIDWQEIVHPDVPLG